MFFFEKYNTNQDLFLQKVNFVVLVAKASENTLFWQQSRLEKKARVRRPLN